MHVLLQFISTQDLYASSVQKLVNVLHPTAVSWQFKLCCKLVVIPRMKYHSINLFFFLHFYEYHGFIISHILSHRWFKRSFAQKFVFTGSTVILESPLDVPIADILQKCKSFEIGIKPQTNKQTKNIKTKIITKNVD